MLQASRLTLLHNHYLTYGNWPLTRFSYVLHVYKCFQGSVKANTKLVFQSCFKMLALRPVNILVNHFSAQHILCGDCWGIGWKVNHSQSLFYFVPHGWKKYGRIKFSPGRWTTTGPNALKWVRAYAKGSKTFHGINFHSFFRLGRPIL